MSPEQAEGKPVDARSDIFSFGAVLYEMVTGGRAFRGDTKLAILSAILKDEPQPVSSVREDVPRDLERIITRCLRKDRERRFQHMDDVRVALEELKEESESDSGTALTPTAIKTVAASLAVLEFEDLSHDPSMDWLGTGIAETLTANLTKLKLLRIVSPERVHRAAAQQTGRDAAALGEALQVRWVITGSFQRAGNRVRITPRLLDVSIDQVLATGKVDGSWEDIFELQDRVVAELCAALRMEVDSSAKERRAAASSSPPPRRGWRRRGGISSGPSSSTPPTWRPTPRWARSMRCASSTAPTRTTWCAPRGTWSGPWNWTRSWPSPIRT